MIKFLGVGSMIRKIYGNDATVDAFQKCLDKKIAAINVTNNVLYLSFKDGSRLKISDHGQSCCESRYMSTDDDLESFVGAELLGADIKDAPDVENDGEVHEVQFLELITDKGPITFANHNENNGYYGGFSIEAILD